MCTLGQEEQPKQTARQTEKYLWQASFYDIGYSVYP